MPEMKVAPPVPWGRVALAWLALCTFLLIRGASDIALRNFPDPDDTLRLVQVRDLLAGQGWFDLHQYRVNAPDGVLMHWSRIVDLPLAATIALLTPLVGQNMAEQIMLVAMPLLTLGTVVAVIAKAASYHLSRDGVTFACLCAGLSPLLLVQVQPLRIDHHGWQIFFAMLALVGVAQGKRAHGPILAGAAIAAGVAISLEILPVAAGFGAVFALRWLTNPAAKIQLPVFLAALTVTLGILFLTTRGLVDTVEHCDALSPGHIGMFAIVAIGAVAAMRISPKSHFLLIGMMGLAALGGLGFYLLRAPECATGPFASLDPLVRSFWYENIAEGRPVWLAPAKLWLPIVGHGVIVLGILFWAWRTTDGDERQWWQDYLVLTAIAFVAGLFVWRSMAFVGALSAIPLGLFAARVFAVLRQATLPMHKLALCAALILGLVPSFPFVLAGLVLPDNAKAAEIEVGPRGGGDCQLDDSVEALDALPAAKIFSPLDIGPALLERSHHSVVATGHHRGVSAMHDVIAAFRGPPQLAKELVLEHRAQYLMICTRLGEVQLYAKSAPTGFAAQLVEGRIPSWLEPIDIEGPPALKFWRVKSAVAD